MQAGAKAMTSQQDITQFWIDEVGPQGWYDSTEALDQEIRTRFGETWQTAAAGGFQHHFVAGLHDHLVGLGGVFAIDHEAAGLAVLAALKALGADLLNGGLRLTAD